MTASPDPDSESTNPQRAPRYWDNNLSEFRPQWLVIKGQTYLWLPEIQAYVNEDGFHLDFATYRPASRALRAWRLNYLADRDAAEENWWRREEARNAAELARSKP